MVPFVLRTALVISFSFPVCATRGGVRTPMRVLCDRLAPCSFSHGHKRPSGASSILCATPSKLRDSVQCPSLSRTFRNLVFAVPLVAITVNHARIIAVRLSALRAVRRPVHRRLCPNEQRLRRQGFGVLCTERSSASATGANPPDALTRPGWKSWSARSYIIFRWSSITA